MHPSRLVDVRHERRQVKQLTKLASTTTKNRRTHAMAVHNAPPGSARKPHTNSCNAMHNTGPASQGPLWVKSALHIAGRGLKGAAATAPQPAEVCVCVRERERLLSKARWIWRQSPGKAASRARLD